jgi:hypothetical protein
MPARPRGCFDVPAYAQGDDPDAGHMVAQPDSSQDPPETLSDAPVLILSTPSTPILRETAAAQDLINMTDPI